MCIHNNKVMVHFVVKSEWKSNPDLSVQLSCLFHMVAERAQSPATSERHIKIDKTQANVRSEKMQPNTKNTLQIQEAE